MAWGERDFDEMSKSRQQLEFVNENLTSMAGTLKYQPTIRQIYKAHILAGMMSNLEHSRLLRPDSLAKLAGEIADAAIREDTDALDDQNPKPVAVAPNFDINVLMDTVVHETSADRPFDALLKKKY
jgi:hypothetical protein